MAQIAQKFIKRLFTKAGTDIYEMFDWVRQTAEISNPTTGEVVYQQKDVEFPASWSQNAINIVSTDASAYSGNPARPITMLRP